MRLSATSLRITGDSEQGGGNLSARYMVFVADNESSAYLDDLSFWRVIQNSDVAGFIASGYSDLSTASLFAAVELPTSNDICFVGGYVGTLYGSGSIPEFSGLTCASLTIALIAGIAATQGGAIVEILALDVRGNLILGRSGEFLPMSDYISGYVNGDVTCYYPATQSDLFYSGTLYVFDAPVPRSLYHSAAGSQLDNLSYWYEDQAFTIPATALPTTIDTCYLAPAGYGSTDLTGALTCSTLYTYGTVYFYTGGAPITAIDIYVNSTVDNNAAYLVGGDFPETATITSSNYGAFIGINAPYATVTLNGEDSTYASACNSCILAGTACSFTGVANLVTATGESASVSGMVYGNVYLYGIYSNFAGSCESVYISSENSYMNYGGAANFVFLEGINTYMSYGTSCNIDLYMTGANSSIGYGVSIYGNVYYDPSTTTDPTDSGAYIVGSVIQISTDAPTDTPTDTPP